VIAVEVDAKKVTLQAEEVWEKLQRAEKIFIAKGQKVLMYVPGQKNKDELMYNVLGRSGNLRAPTIRVGNTYYVGYNEIMYKELTTT
jgi:hypothetical protein